jgi:PncC family amidohydrolase
MELLLEQGRTIAIAESLTGGLISDGLVAVPGSRVFVAGYVTYSNRAKIEMLGVPEAVIDARARCQCARAMAEGARKKSGSTSAS